MTDTRPIRRGAALALLLLLAASASAAQVTMTPRALGTGGAYLGLARGHEALFLNPANLGLRGTPRWSFAVPQVGAGSSFVGVKAGDLPDLLNYDDLADERKAEILAGIPESGFATDVDVRVPIAVFQRGRLSLGVAYGALVHQTVGRDLVELLLEGYHEGSTDYSSGGTAGSRATFLDFAVGYGRRVGPVSVGVTGHWLRGRTLARSRLFEPRVDLEVDDVELEYREVMARGGSGWSVDVGAAAEPVRNLVVSAAVAGVASRMEWSRSLATRSLVVDRATFEGQDPGALLERLEASEAEAPAESSPLTALVVSEDLYDAAYFPATLRTGVAWTLPRTRTSLAAGYQEVLTEGRLGGGWDRQLSAGIEQKVPLLTLRAGIATDLADARMLSGGVSLGPIQVGVARTSQSLPNGAERTGWVGTFGLSARTTASVR